MKPFIWGYPKLIVYGDSKLVINKVKDKISARYHYLNIYSNRVWELLESFLAINMISIPRKYNQIVNALADKGARLDHAHCKRGAHGVNVLCKPSIPNTTNFW